ncbi:MAG: hypothetical protein VX910_03135 [Candidatus Latescibacterota bacterium]|nr:hypothetical protein [Candidatus Latescibacterota bacterium]
MNLNIPVRSFFEFEQACPVVDDTSFLKGTLRGWSERNKLPDLMALDQKDNYADVYIGWNADGIYFGVNAKGSPGLEVDPKRPLKGDGVQIWIDTRDVREAHRASRFCHHFYFLPTGGRSDGPVAGQVRIRRAREQGKPCEPQNISVFSRVSKKGFRLSAFLPADILNGFEPEDNNRFGFTYLIRDRKLGRQCWTADEPLPVGYDPSLWGTITLTP